ncbi:MAG: ArsR family transcriptional regulator [Candidatus Thorarchaeota archaeon]|nr:ArsR family transcriptional regulator [Candidatus Thorarchaeota archaeon]
MATPDRVEPMKDLEVISDPETLKVLFDHVRAEIVFKYLCKNAMTVKQLSDALGKNPGTILHHIDKLKAAGLVVQERTEQTVTGIVQRYYRATAREFRLGISEMMRSEGGVRDFAAKRLSSMVSGLAVYGVEIPEHDMAEAIERLQRLIERENEVSSDVPIVDSRTYDRLPKAVRDDASRIMRRFVLDTDPEYTRLREEWHAFLQSHLRTKVKRQ